MTPRGLTVLVENPALLPFGRHPIAGVQRCRVLVPSVLGHGAPPVLGNKIYEASTLPSVTIFMRQIASLTAPAAPPRLAATRAFAMRRSPMAGKAQTVLGPIPGDELGITLPHEHL